ncbi:MAG: DUF342 domain-containing protein [Oscillospiraceae bacterium]|nr:DUF342 domain-containing protein [Oscillospiraceae bacterium]
MPDTKVNLPVHSTVSVSVASNASEAYVLVNGPKFGGEEVSESLIRSALDANKITYGIKDDMIKRIVLEKLYGDKYVIAEWTKPENGIDGTITYYYDKQNIAAPVEDDRGFVDYKNLGMVRTVYAGDVIADITMPTEGTPGMDVRGRVLRQKPGRKAQYGLGTNTALTPDGKQIVASVDGNINYKNGAFCIEQVVTINGDLDSSVGNISFVGDVIVKGEVLEGFKISSNANIIVHGNVNGAVLEADGDILIKKGCINSTVVAHGSVTINFCEHSNIRCDGDVTSSNFIICDVYCGGYLTTKGKNGGGLMGGKYTCLNSVEISGAGTKNYTPTLLTIGDNALLSEEKANVNKQIEKLSGDLEKVVQIIEFLNHKKKELHTLPEDKEEILGNACRQKILIGVETKKLIQRINEIDIALAQKQYLSVKCSGYMYPGVKIVINDATFKVEDEYVRTRIVLSEDGEIHAAPL